MTDLQRISMALDDLAAGYRHDGYELIIERVIGGTVHVRISALENACEDCLVPKDVAAMIIKASLTDVPEVTGVEIVYPAQANDTTSAGH